MSRRVASIDILRGLTMLVMIFVNDLAGVRGLPWWNYHMPGEANGMTYVDMVFPLFLFWVGMSMPLAIEKRLRKGNLAQLWKHVIARTFSLLVLGLALANVGLGDARWMGISSNTWGALMMLGAVLFWNVYPDGGRTILFRGLRATGSILMLVMFAIFRRTTQSGDVRWLSFGYWEILGLIGWTYLAVCLLYIPTRRWRWAPAVWFVAMLGLNIASAAKWIAFPDELPFYFWPWNNGCFSAIVLAGVLCERLGIAAGKRDRGTVIQAITFGCALLAAGWILSPLGVSKIRATPSWALFSAGAAVLLFCLVHWIADVRGRQRWAAFTKAAGENTLLTYLLPDMFYFAVSTRWLPAFTGWGFPGAVKSAVFTIAMLALATLLTKWKVRLAV